MEYLAHIRADGTVQSLEDHLNGTADLAGRFAAAFGAEDWGRTAGLLHDVGKSSAEFQARLRGGPKVDHATAGAQIAQKLGLGPVAFAVAGHHGGLPDGGNHLDRAEESTLAGRLKRRELPAFEEPGTVDRPKNWPFPAKNRLEASFFIRMLYSCLVDADFLDTEDFMSGGTVERGHYDSLSVLRDRLEEQLQKWSVPRSPLNEKRNQILAQCQAGGEKPRGLYTMTVPTGGGKTTASMTFALNHALANGMERVIYVIPYTSIIEQNAEVFESLLGEENVVQHHSNVDWEEDAGETTSANLKKRLSTENWDAPVIVTTAVQFFESLYAAKPSRCRKLHNIANSVIIFDEAQTLPLPYLRPCVAAMGELVRHYRSTAVLCTATQPSLGKMFGEFAPEYPIEELCPGAEGECFRRYTLRRGPVLSEETLAQRLNGEEQVLCIVNSRACAQRVFECLEGPGRYHLSTLMTPDHRRRVLAEVRGRLKAGEPCRVVSTSLIEAGVDVDFPCVYREEAGLDSVLQAAGRCNREGKRRAEDSLVWLFRLENQTVPQFRQQVGVLRETEVCFPDLTGREAISAYFTALFGLRPEELDKKKVLRAFLENLDGCEYPFRQVAEQVRLVESGTVPVVIPGPENEGYIQALLRGEFSMGLMRKLGKYCVNVYHRDLQKLRECGAVMRVDEDSELFLLIDNWGYRESTGLSLDISQGDAFFL